MIIPTLTFARRSYQVSPEVYLSFARRSIQVFPISQDKYLFGANISISSIYSGSSTTPTRTLAPQ